MTTAQVNTAVVIKPSFRLDTEALPQYLPSHGKIGTRSCFFFEIVDAHPDLECQSEKELYGFQTEFREAMREALGAGSLRSIVDGRVHLVDSKD